MISVNDLIIEDYINNSLLKHQKDWYFSIHPFSEVSIDKKEVIKEIAQVFKKEIDDFIPLNQNVLTLLFPNYNQIDVPIDLIVGFPDPYDAVTITGPDQKTHVIMDIHLFSNYNLPKDRYRSIIKNFITHELTHVLIQDYYQNIIKETDYIAQLNAIVFDEGFAHLLSFNGLELNDQAWVIDNQEDFYSNSIKKLNNAKLASDVNEQKEYLLEANAGSYYDKFGAIAGMLYLRNVYIEKGTAGLKEEFQLGYRDIIKRITEEL